MAVGSHNKSTRTCKHKQRDRGSSDSRRPDKISSAAATFSDSQRVQDIFLICLNYITTLINAHWIIFSPKTLSTPSCARFCFFLSLLLLCRSHSFKMQSIPLPGENPEAKDPLWTSHYPHHHITAVSSEARRSKAD